MAPLASARYTFGTDLCSALQFHFLSHLLGFSLSVPNGTHYWTVAMKVKLLIILGTARIWQPELVSIGLTCKTIV